MTCKKRHIHTTAAILAVAAAAASMSSTAGAPSAMVAAFVAVNPNSESGRRDGIHKESYIRRLFAHRVKDSRDAATVTETGANIDDDEIVFDPLNLSAQESSGFVVQRGREPAGAAVATKNHQQGDDLQGGGDGGGGDELGIWAARGILLLVAVIWGTNFAVSVCRRSSTYIVLEQTKTA